MWRTVFVYFFLQYVVGERQILDDVTKSQLCGNPNKTELSCTSQIFEQSPTDDDFCKIKVYPPDSLECSSMTFKPVSSGYNQPRIGGVTLNPYTTNMIHYYNNLPVFDMTHTVINMTFNNIKWKTMHFRFQDRSIEYLNHCRTFMLSDPTIINIKSELFYDCYWPITDNRDGQAHILDFEATAEDGSVDSVRYYFNIPSVEMLSSKTKEDKWKPFVYIEMFSDILRLHIKSPFPDMNITAYIIQVLVSVHEKGSPQEVELVTVNLMSNTDEETYDYNYGGTSGFISFVVTPLHEICLNKRINCQEVKTPVIRIKNDFNIFYYCGLFISGLIVMMVLAYYLVLPWIRHRRHKDDSGQKSINQSPKILVVNSPANSHHVRCVELFVKFLRSEYGFDVMYDGDIRNTPHRDPFEWAEEAFVSATHVIYCVGPAAEPDKAIITPHQNVDDLIILKLKANCTQKSPKDLINVFFEYSDTSQNNIPKVTRLAKSFTLKTDWRKLISHLSKNMSPEKVIMRSEKGKRFLEDLNQAKKLLGGNNDDEIVVRWSRENFWRRSKARLEKILKRDPPSPEIFLETVEIPR